MSEENNKPEDDEVDDSVEDTEDEDLEDTEEESGSNALAGLAGAAAAGALARKGSKGSKKPAKGKAKAGAKTVPAKAKPASISKDGSVDVNAKIDEIQQLTDKNKVWTIAGFSFTPAKLMILGTILSSALGGLYGAFEVYKDYQAMKKQITNYVAPDLSVFDKRLEVVTEKAEKSVQYTQDIKNDLKQDIRRLEGIVDNVERGVKQSQRETQQDVQEVRKDLKQVSKEVDSKIKQALDNPLANK